MGNYPKISFKQRVYADNIVSTKCIYRSRDSPFKLLSNTDYGDEKKGIPSGSNDSEEKYTHVKPLKNAKIFYGPLFWYTIQKKIAALAQNEMGHHSAAGKQDVA